MPGHRDYFGYCIFHELRTRHALDVILNILLHKLFVFVFI